LQYFFIDVLGEITGVDFSANKQYVDCSHMLRSVHTTLEKFGNGVFTLKTHEMFSVHTTPKDFENATLAGDFGFVFQENSGRENDHMIIMTPSLLKSSVFKMFSLETV